MEEEKKQIQTTKEYGTIQEEDETSYETSDFSSIRSEITTPEFKVYIEEENQKIERGLWTVENERDQETSEQSEGD